MAVPGRYSGQFKSYMPSKGYGFITCDYFDGDIFFPRRSLPEELQAREIYGPASGFTLKEYPVAFDLVQGNDGKQQAQNLVLSTPEGNPTYIGTIKRWNAQKGYGFLDCFMMEGRDILFGQRSIPFDLKGVPLVGMLASFKVQERDDGKLSADNLTLLMGDQGLQPQAMHQPPPQVYQSPLIGLHPGARKDSRPAMRPMMNQRGAGNVIEGQVMHGKVKSFFEEKGYGFISAPGCPTDVYFKDVGGSQWAAGHDISFTAHVMPDGVVRAREVRGGLEDAGNVIEGQVMQGKVKSFFPEKGYGFISATGCPTDIYFKDLGGSQWAAGHDVSFTAHVMPDGVVRAREVQGDPYSRPLQQTSTADLHIRPLQQTSTAGLEGEGNVIEGQVMHGKVKSFNSEKGYGFISAPSCPTDIYFKDLGGSQWAAGHAVSFTAQVMPDGVVRAREVQGDPYSRPLQQTSTAHLHSRPLQHTSTAGHEGQIMHGKVKSFFAEKGYGFINATGCPTDVYFKDLSGSQWAAGHAVSFTAHVMPDGVVRAQDVQGGLEEGMELVGTVKRYNSDKGYGFLVVPDRAGDIYFKKDLVPPELLASDLQGMTVRFTVGMRPDGVLLVREGEFLPNSPSGYQAPPLQQKRPASTPLHSVKQLRTR